LLPFNAAQLLKIVDADTPLSVQKLAVFNALTVFLVVAVFGMLAARAFFF
jgi:hypothetical protein